MRLTKPNNTYNPANDPYRVKWLIRFWCASNGFDGTELYDLNGFIADALYADRGGYKFIFTTNSADEFHAKVRACIKELVDSQHLILKNKRYFIGRLSPVIPCTSADTPYLQRKALQGKWLRIERNAHNDPALTLAGWLYSCLSPESFEKFCLYYIKEVGLQDIELSQRFVDGRDAGIDAIGNFKGRDVFKQAKKWRPDHVVGVGDIQAFLDKVDHLQGHIAIFITTSSFDSNAKKLERQILEEHAQDKKRKVLMLVSPQEMLNDVARVIHPSFGIHAVTSADTNQLKYFLFSPDILTNAVLAI